MITLSFDLSWFCIPIFIIAYVGIIIFLARRKFRWSARDYQRFLDARSKGAFDNLSQPQMKTKIRLLALISLIGGLAMMAFTLLLILLALRIVPVQGSSRLILIGVFIILGVLAAVLLPISGILLRDEFNRRL